MAGVMVYLYGWCYDIPALLVLWHTFLAGVMALCYDIPVWPGVMAYLYGWCYGIPVWLVLWPCVMAYLYGWCYGITAFLRLWLT